MQRKPVKSSNIAAIGYDPDTAELEIEFSNGGVYRYADVPAEDHGALVASDSIGAHFFRRIKNRFKCHKVELLPVLVAGEPDQFEASVAMIEKERHAHTMLEHLSKQAAS